MQRAVEHVSVRLPASPMWTVVTFRHMHLFMFLLCLLSILSLVVVSRLYVLPSAVSSYKADHVGIYTACLPTLNAEY